MLKVKNEQFGKFISKNLVENIYFYILDNMTNCKDLLAQELKIYYPEITDDKLNEMTSNLIDYYKTAVKIVLKDEFNQIKEAIDSNED